MDFESKIARREISELLWDMEKTVGTAESCTGGRIAEAIIAIQVGWMEEFAKKYPHMAGNARRIHTSEDTPYDTSYETYLRGELGTYSDDTLYLYGRFVVGLERQGKNLAYMIMDNTAKLYGYRDVKDAEEKLSYS